MAMINKTNVIIPEVMADLMQFEYENALILGKLAYQDNTLVGNPGDTITIPYVAPLTDASIVTDGSPLVPEANSDSKITIAIQAAGKAVEITQAAINSAAYDVKSERRNQIVKAIARKVDADLATELATTALVHNTLTFDYAAIVDAKGKMGEEGFSSTNVLIVPSALYAELAKTPEFIAGAVQVSDFGLQASAMLVDMPVIVSDRIAANEAYIVVPGSFVLANKQLPVVYGDVNILTETTVMSTFVHYGVKLPNKNRGVVKITKN